MTVPGYEWELRPMIRGRSPVIQVRDVLGSDGGPFNFDGWTVRFLAKRWLDDNTPPTFIRSTAPQVGGVEVVAGQLGALDITPFPEDTAHLLDGVASDKVVLFWEIEAIKGTRSVTVESGTLPVVRSIDVPV